MVDPQSHPGGRYYERLISDTLLGVWAYKARVGPAHLEDFSLRSRGGKRLLIKEVNPLLARLLSGADGPKILFLVRHPASVADSYLRLGWLKQSWSEFGRQYGNDLAESIDSCESALVLHYEEFALDPEAKFADLFEQLSVRSPTDFDNVIQTHCYTEGAGNRPYETARISHDQVRKWRQSLDRTQIEALREGYFASNLPFYRADADWM